MNDFGHNFSEWNDGLWRLFVIVEYFLQKCVSHRGLCILGHKLSNEHALHNCQHRPPLKSAPMATTVPSLSSPSISAPNCTGYLVGNCVGNSDGVELGYFVGYLVGNSTVEIGQTCHCASLHVLAISVYLTAVRKLKILTKVSRHTPHRNRLS